MKVKKCAAITLLLMLCHFGFAQPFLTMLIEYRVSEDVTEVVVIDREQNIYREFRAPWLSVWAQVLAFIFGLDLAEASLIDVVTEMGADGWELAAAVADPTTGWISYYFQADCAIVGFC